MSGGNKALPFMPTDDTGRRRINDLRSAMSLSFTRAKCESLIMFRGSAGL